MWYAFFVFVLILNLFALVMQIYVYILTFFIDNIDTRAALEAVRELVSQSNIYTKNCKNPNTLLLRDIAVYITKLFTMFGAISSSHDAIGFPVDDGTTNQNVTIDFSRKPKQKNTFPKIIVTNRLIIILF